MRAVTLSPMPVLLVLLVGLMLVVPAPSRAADDSLYLAFGKKAGIAGLSRDFVDRLKTDPRVGHFFKDTKPEGLTEQLTAQICVVSGGPCKYEGATMPKAHLDMHITRADFNAVVEILQDAMDARGIPFAEQNRLLARLAPMHREIEGR